MHDNLAAAPLPAVHELSLTRAYDFPREKVYDAWISPAIFQRWWGPAGSTMSECELDARPGGAMRYAMRVPGARDHWMSGQFTEVRRPEHLVFGASFVDGHGRPTGHPVLSGWPADATFVTRIGFEAQAGRTKLTVRQKVSGTGFRTGLVFDERKMARDIWGQSLDRLGELLVLG